jgi:hypothetical protein
MSAMHTSLPQHKSFIRLQTTDDCTLKCAVFAFFLVPYNFVENLSIKRQKEPRKIIEETSECVNLERASKWPNFMIAT